MKNLFVVAVAASVAACGGTTNGGSSTSGGSPSSGSTTSASGAQGTGAQSSTGSTSGVASSGGPSGGSGTASGASGGSTTGNSGSTSASGSGAGTSTGGTSGGGVITTYTPTLPGGATLDGFGGAAYGTGMEVDWNAGLIWALYEAQLADGGFVEGLLAMAVDGGATVDNVQSPGFNALAVAPDIGQVYVTSVYGPDGGPNSTVYVVDETTFSRSSFALPSDTFNANALAYDPVYGRLYASLAEQVGPSLAQTLVSYDVSSDQQIATYEIPDAGFNGVTCALGSGITCPVDGFGFQMAVDVSGQELYFTTYDQTHYVAAAGTFTFTGADGGTLTSLVGGQAQGWAGAADGIAIFPDGGAAEVYEDTDGGLWLLEMDPGSDFLGKGPQVWASGGVPQDCGGSPGLAFVNNDYAGNLNLSLSNTHGGQGDPGVLGSRKAQVGNCQFFATAISCNSVTTTLGATLSITCVVTFTPNLSSCDGGTAVIQTFSYPCR